MRATKVLGRGGLSAMNGRPVQWPAVLVAVLGLAQAAAASPIADAARKADLAEARELIASGAAVDAAHADGTTPLIWAAYQAYPELVSLLLEHGADPDLANDFGITPLLQAGRYGDVEVLRILLDAGADIALAHPEGETALMGAARTGRVDAVLLLLERGADPNAAESLGGQTALMWAADEGHVDVVDALLDAGADPDLQARVAKLTKRSINADFPSGGFSAAMFAARDGHEAVLERLAEAGADFALTNGDGATASMIAIVNDRFDLAVRMLGLGADPNDGSLYYAVLMRDATTDWLAQDGSRLRPDYENEHTALDLVRVLLEAGADPNKAFSGQMHSRTMCCDTFENGTPFYRAAIAADVAALELLIEHGADLEWTPERVESGAMGANSNVGKTPLMVAMTGGKGVGMAGGPGDIREGRAPPFREEANRTPADAVRLILEAGADPDATAPDGAAALHQAVQQGKLEMVRILADGGAALDLPNADGHTALWLAENPLDEEKYEGAVIMAQDERDDPAEIAALLRARMQDSNVPAQASAGSSAQ